MMQSNHHIWSTGIINRDAEKWMEEQGWERIKDWQYWGSMSKGMNNDFCHYVFEDANKATLFKLTWGTSTP